MVRFPDTQLLQSSSNAQSPNELVSLLELLHFYADEFVNLQRELTWITTSLYSLEYNWLSRKWTIKDKKMWVEFRGHLEVLRTLLAEAHLDYCLEHVDALLRKLDSNKFLQSSDIAGLEDNLERELRGRVFLAVPADRQAYFSFPLKGWEAVIQSFPDAQDDVEEMNKCYALSRYTAAVFHSLLVVEHGLIALGHRIGVSDPKPGWDATYKRLSWLVNNRSSVPADLDFDFLEQTKARLDSMKLAWRNKVNHAAGKLAIEKSGFTDVSAEEVIIACRSFMRNLAGGLTSSTRT